MYFPSFFFFSGEAELVEMVIDDVIIEVSKHRGVGRVYLTNFRLVTHLDNLQISNLLFTFLIHSSPVDGHADR